MNSKLKKITGSIATIIVVIIGAFFYLSAPEDSVDSTTENSYQQVTEDQQVSEPEVEIEEEASEVTVVEEEKTQDSTELTEEVVQEEFYEFRKQQYLDEHFDKHGEEFDYDNAQEYLEGANRVINDPNSLYKTENEDGDHIYYLESTNEFVVVSTDGYIRTYFKPSAGIDYFNRQ
ncbi:MAG: hypothetical protein IJX85_02240 [Lachnospiraceae bacterium]|nr:hypothetical protein [Lachnospiraceae bacterium]